MEQREGRAGARHCRKCIHFAALPPIAAVEGVGAPERVRYTEKAPNAWQRRGTQKTGESAPERVHRFRTQSTTICNHHLLQPAITRHVSICDQPPGAPKHDPFIQWHVATGVVWRTDQLARGTCRHVINVKESVMFAECSLASIFS